MNTRTVSNTLNSVLATDPFLAAAAQGSLVAVPVLLTAGQLSQQPQAPNQTLAPALPAIALSGLYSQAAAINASFTSQQTTTVIPGSPGTPAGRSVAWSPPSFGTATATPAATVGTYNIQVSSLAVPQVTTGNSVPKNNASGLNSGTLAITVNGSTTNVAFTASPTDTNGSDLTNIANAINNNPTVGAQLSAAVKNAGGGANVELVVTARTAGTAGQFSIGAADFNGLLAVLQYGLNNPPSIVAANATYTINGTPGTAASGNTTTIDSGNLALNFLKTGSSTVTVTGTGGTPPTPPTATTVTKLVGNVLNFVAAFNNLQDYLTANAPVLNPQIQQELNGFVQANAAPLAVVGLTVNPDRTLSANQTTLFSIATSSPSTVQAALFGPGGLGSVVSSLSASIASALKGQLPSSNPSAILPSSGGVMVNLLA